MPAGPMPVAPMQAAAMAAPEPLRRLMLLALLLLGAACDSDALGRSAAPGRIRFLQSALDFGAVEIGTEKRLPFEFVVDGERTVELLANDFEPFDSAFQVLSIPERLAPGETGRGEMRFRPRRTTPALSTLVLTTDGDAPAVLDVSGIGFGGATPDAGPSAVPDAGCPPIPQGPCVERCRIEFTGAGFALGPGCGTRVQGSRFSPPEAYLTLDMHGLTGLQMDLEACDPQGWLFHLADAPGCVGSLGDTPDGGVGQSSRDAQLFVLGDELRLIPSDPHQPRNVSHYYLPQFLPLSGCATRTLWVADSFVQSTAPRCGLQQSDWALRIDPPSDAVGQPDALWYLALHGVYGTGTNRTGRGLKWVELCLR